MSPPLPRGLRVTLTELRPATLLAEVHGELDLATAPHLQARLTTALTSTGYDLLVVDLDEMRFLCAAGVSALLHVRAQARRRDTVFRVIASRRPVLRPLTVLDLRTTLQIHPTRALALVANPLSNLNP